MKLYRVAWATIACLFLFFTATLATGQVPQQINFQGMLTDDLGYDSVTASEIASGAVGSSEIADGSVSSVDLADGAALAEILDDDEPGSGLNADRLDGLSSHRVHRGYPFSGFFLSDIRGICARNWPGMRL